MPLPIGHWTEERIDALKLYASQGYTCSQIAGLLGMATRNSIIGKLHRLGLSTKNQPGGGFKKKLSRPKPRTLKSRIASTKWSASGSKVIPPLDFEDLLAADVVPRHLTISQLEGASCRYPYGEGPYTYCGHDKAEASSYCGQHHAIVYKRPDQRKPRPDIAANNRRVFAAKGIVLAALETAEEAA